MKTDFKKAEENFCKEPKYYTAGRDTKLDRSSPSERSRTIKKPKPEIVFAMRMFMLKYNLTPADILKILVVLENG